MLTVQPVRVSQQLPFRSTEASNDYRYTKDQFQSDKTALEEQLEDINSVIEDVNVPKPVRAFGKLVSVGIGAALGFVSMKYGAQGMAKVVKKGAEHVGNTFQKPFMKNIGEKFVKVGKAIREFFVKIYNKIAESSFGKAIGNFFKGIGEKFKGSKVGSKIAEMGNNISELNIVKKASAKAAEIKEAAKGAVAKVTGEKVENGVVNLFAVSGGVSGGVSALQEATKD